MENDENPEAAFKREVSNVYIGRGVEDTNKLNVTEKEKNEGSRIIWETPERALELVKNCYETLVESNYGSIYATKFVVLRDRKILEYYIENYF